MDELRPLTVLEAVDSLNGHAILSADGARRVCLTLGIELDETLVMSWQTVQEAYDKYGFFATKEAGDGVDGLRLSYHVAKALGIQDPPGRNFTGKGFQSRANQQAIRQRLSELGRL